MTLSDLTHAFQPIATSTVGADGRNRWNWRISSREVSVFYLARDQGGIIAGQRRVDGDRFDLVAKLAGGVRA